MHEAKVDIVTVPNLSEHLSNAATTAQLSARFGYAAAMKSINNLLLLGDGESWSRQTVDFSGLPEMVRTFLQVAAGAADIPVTRLLGQSPAGLSATGDSDTRNYYDMISSRQELDLRPQLERLDGLLLRSAGVEPGSLGFTFRPLWQLSAAEKAGVALQKAQTTAIYAGLQLWPSATTAALVRSQLTEDGTYPGAASAFAASSRIDPEWIQSAVADFDPDQPRDDHGRWTNGGGGSRADTPPAEVAAAASDPQTEAPRGPGQKHGPYETEENLALRTAMHMAVLPFAARQAVLSAMQVVANLFRGKPAESPSETKPSEPPNEPDEVSAADPDPYKGQNIPFDRSNLESKIKNYLLNPDHRDNNGKAKFLESNLGIDASNWEELANQIQFDKDKAVLDSKRTRDSAYGNVHYDQDVRVTGP